MPQPSSQSPVDPPRREQLVFDDGEPLESARHRQQMEVLIQSLEYSYRGRDDFYVGGNMFLYFSETQVKRNDFRGPDVFVALGTDKREREAWIVWEENGKTPDVIVELLSESTAAVDRGEKKRVYERVLKIGEYFLFDPFSAELEGFTLDAARGVYVPKEPDEKGRLRCERLDLWVGTRRGTHYSVETDWLRWIDAHDELLATPWEHARALASEADAATARADALERELQELKGKTEL